MSEPTEKNPFDEPKLAVQPPMGPDQEATLSRAVAIRDGVHMLHRCRSALAGETPLFRGTAYLPVFSDQVEALDLALLEAARPFLREAEVRLRDHLRSLSADLSQRVEALASETDTDEEEG